MKKLKFIRYGGLSPVKQKHYVVGDEKSFHNPPRKRGIYAFPYPYVEKFLLGSTNHPTHPSNKTKWLKDENGNKILFDDLVNYDDNYNISINKKYINLIKKLKIRISDINSSSIDKDGNSDKYYAIVYNKPKIFEYDGNIWHHLGEHLKPEQIIEKSGSWVKSNIDDYKLAFKLEKNERNKEMLKIMKKFENDINKYFNVNSLKNFFSKDHLEVFIEKIK